MWTIFAYAKLRKGKSCWLWSIPKCPICGQEHQHGGGSLSKDPRRALTVPRVKHCDDTHPPMDDEKRRLVKQGVNIAMVEDPELHGYFLHYDHMVELGRLVDEKWRRQGILVD